MPNKKTSIKSLTIFLGVAATIAGFQPRLAAADDYPNRVVQLIVPYPPGGGVDTVGRVIAQKLTDALGQNVIVVNRPGAGSVIGVRDGAKAAPDGYTILMLVTGASLPANTGYDLHKDFAPIGLIAVLSRAPMASGEFVESILKIFAVRASAELERQRAEETLRRARQARSVYISSNTPVASLNELVRRRGWLSLVDAVYGYPRRKVDTVRQIVADCGGRGDLVLVVGDGMSDEAAARENGCVFVAVDARVGLTPVLNLLEASDVPG